MEEELNKPDKQCRDGEMQEATKLNVKANTFQIKLQLIIFIISSFSDYFLKELFNCLVYKVSVTIFQD